MADKPIKRNDMSDMVHRIKENNKPVTKKAAEEMVKTFRDEHPDIAGHWTGDKINPALYQKD